MRFLTPLLALRWVLWVVGVLCLSTPQLALAQKKLTPAERAEAKKAYEEAEKSFKLQEYAMALEGYKKVFVISENPALLFNIGQCHRLLERNEEAVKAYSSFLNELPSSPLRPDVEKLIADLEEKIKADAQAKAEAEAREKERLERERQLEIEKLERERLERERLEREAAAASQAATAPATQVVVIPSSPKRSTTFFFGAGAGAALSLSAGGVGIFLGLKSAQLQAEEQPAEVIEKNRTNAVRLGITADALMGAALVCAGVGLYFKLQNERLAADLNLSPAGLLVRY